MPPKPWADTPWPLIQTPSLTLDIKKHSAIHIASIMTHTHNCIIRGINSIFLQAPHVHEPTDIADLLFFCKAWCNWVEHHHSLEETSMFPGFEELSGRPGCMAANIEQHHAFEPGLKRLRGYAVETNPSQYDSSLLRDIINSFATTLQQHLTDEIATLLALQDCDSDKLLATYKKAETTAAGQSKDETYPLVLGLCDKTYEGGVHDFPPAPWFAPYVVHYLFGRKHAGAWRFCPSDTWGRPRKLMFGGRE